MLRTTRVFCHTCRRIRTFQVVGPRNPEDRPELVCLLCGSRETVPPTLA